MKLVLLVRSLSSSLLLSKFHSQVCNIHGLAGSADSDVSYGIASQGEMADAMGFSVG
jgi:hypothetical protein